MNDPAISHGKKTCPSCGLGVESQVTVCPRDGTPLVMNIAADPMFDKYEFIESVGAGGMGVIYKARHLILNKVVAIKTLHAHLVTPEAMRRFQIEGRATSSLSHPSIIAIQDFGVTPAGQAFMVMDFIDGKTLADVLRRDGQLSSARFKKIFVQVCDALEHAHKHSVLHRDVKPSNIMLRVDEAGDEEVRLMDFGIAKIMSDTESGASQLTRTGEAIGSPSYMSPEQARGEKTDHRSDLYSLGCVMYEALSGSPPFESNAPLTTMMMHLERQPMSLKQASLGRVIDANTEAAVMRLLEKNPADRFQTVSELKYALFEDKEPSSGKKTTAGKIEAGTTSGAGKKFLSKYLMPIAALTVLGIGLAVLFVFYRADVGERSAKNGHNAGNSSTETRSSDTVALDQYKVDLGKSAARQLINSLLKKGEAKIDLSNVSSVADPLTDDDLSAFKAATGATTSLELQDSDIHDSGLENLKGMKLNYLSLARTKVQDLHALVGMNSLATIDLSGVSLNEEGYRNLHKLSGLRVLILDRARNFDAKNVATLSQLEQIDLNDTDLSSRDLKALGELKNLKVLNINSTSVRDLSPLAGLKNLIELSCFDNQLNKASFLVISSFSKLRILDLNKTPLDDSDLNSLRQLHSLLKLSVLNTNVSLQACDLFSNFMPVLYMTYRGKAPGMSSGNPVSNVELWQTATELIAKKKWVDASDLFEQIANNKSSSPELVANALISRADCLVQMNLLVVAGKIYGDAIAKLTDDHMSDYLAVALCRRASLLEKIGSPDYAKKAIVDRLQASSLLGDDSKKGAFADTWKVRQHENQLSLHRDVVSALKAGSSSGTLASLVPPNLSADTELCNAFNELLNTASVEARK